MYLEQLAHHLANPARIGLTPALARQLGVPDSAVHAQARLLAELGGARGHLAVLFLGCFVVDDTDVFSDGEIYWWSIPLVAGADRRAKTGATIGLPTGMPPHSCGDRQWLTSLSLADPPLWAVIPPGATQCLLRIAVYDDDGKPADLAGAITEGLQAYAAIPNGAPATPELLAPVRDAIFAHLKAKQDDVLIDQDLVLPAGEAGHFSAGVVASLLQPKARVYYLVFDTQHTRRFGPISLGAGQTGTLRFDVPPTKGGRVALFARGDVQCPPLGALNTEEPFLNRVLDDRTVHSLASGIALSAQTPAELCGFYTPPYDYRAFVER